LTLERPKESRMLNELQTLIIELDETIERLGERLEPILTPLSETPPDGQPDVERPQSAMCRQVEVLKYRLLRIHATVAMFVERIDIPK